MALDLDQLAHIKASTQSVYNRKATYWQRQRAQHLSEAKWLDRFIADLPSGARILDLGCGTGSPLAAYFLAKDFDLVGVDYAPAMVEIAA